MRNIVVGCFFFLLAMSCGDPGREGTNSLPNDATELEDFFAALDVPAAVLTAEDQTQCKELEGFLKQDLDGKVFCLGPVVATGEILESVSISDGPLGNHHLDVVMTAEGIEIFNEMASTCVGFEPTCPTSQIALLVDDVIVSAPLTGSGSFARDQIRISGLFEEGEFSLIAKYLNAYAGSDKLKYQNVLFEGYGSGRQNDNDEGITSTTSETDAPTVG